MGKSLLKVGVWPILRTPSDIKRNGQGKQMLVAAAAVAALCKLQGAFVPPAGRAAQVGAAAGTVARLGAAPAYADKIDDAAKKLSEAAYPFLKEIDWTSDVYGKLPTASPAEVLKAIDSMLKMGA